MSDVILLDEAVKLKDLLDNPVNVPKITNELITSALSSAMWEESTNALEILLSHPMCKLPSILEIYQTANTYFGGSSETKKLLRAKIIELGGKDPDELSDDYNSD